MEYAERPRNYSILVIGAGDPGRADDGAGPLAAESVASWGLPDVRALAAPRLVPEMADDLAASDVAIFVEARPGATQADVVVQPVRRSRPAFGVEQLNDPAFLLSLTRVLHGRSPRGWLISLPAADLAHGGDLSPVARHGLDEALVLLRHWIERISSQTIAPEDDRLPEVAVQFA